MLKCWLVTSIRLACLGWFVYATITVTVQSLAALCALLVSLFLIRPSPLAVRIRTNVIDFSKNPLKAKRKDSSRPEIQQLIADVDRRVADLVSYNGEQAASLQEFNPTRLDSPCIFAKKAQLWGSDDWRPHLSLERNVERWMPTFFKFTCLCSEIDLDGFLVQLPGSEFGINVETLSDGVRRLLTTLSSLDPRLNSDYSGTRRSVGCMSNPDRIGRRGWVFEFNRVSFFVTSFASFYPASHPRRCLPDAPPPSAFVLFQPELSFARHDLPPDSTETQWTRPRNVRDRIRVAFRDAGRPYHIPASLYDPMAHQVVRPLDENDPNEFVEWWVDRDTKQATN